ncbi:anti-sigma factor [bacterium]|nr:anti-sigma factor [bacterium]
MNSSESMMRFDGLSAGFALGDLSREEERELSLLSEQLGIKPDQIFELLAASIEVDCLQTAAEPLPAGLAARLSRCAAEIAAAQPANVVTPRIPAWLKIVRSPLTGWAAAAAVALVAALGSQKGADPSPQQAELRLRAEARDLVERKFEGLGSFKAAAGKVIWSDQLQQGYMTLSGIPVNNPAQAQYQLWIVDPKRDEAPVDGGVFDIPTDGSPVVIPISAKLALSHPQAFVITLEQPGGVVKSKQEKVVALAKG